MAKRGVRGEGGVYKRGDGRVVGEYGDANGKRRYVSGKTKAEVRRRLRGLLADAVISSAKTTSSMTASR